MKKIIAPAFSILFFIGILITGVGLMSIYLSFEFVNKYKHIEKEGKYAEVSINKKGTSQSGAGTSRHTTDYFDIDYLGDSKERDFTLVYPSAQEFNAYKEGDLIRVCFDPQDPSEAYLIKTAKDLNSIKNKPFKIILFGCGLIWLSIFVTKRFEKEGLPEK